MQATSRNYLVQCWSGWLTQWLRWQAMAWIFTKEVFDLCLNRFCSSRPLCGISLLSQSCWSIAKQVFGNQHLGGKFVSSIHISHNWIACQTFLSNFCNEMCFTLISYWIRSEHSTIELLWQHGQLTQAWGTGSWPILSLASYDLSPLKDIFLPLLTSFGHPLSFPFCHFILTYHSYLFSGF